MKKAALFKFKEISVGKEISFRRLISRKDIEAFAHLSGDFNPLHIDEKFASGTAFKGIVVHGMLAASLFSRAIGMHCPGRYALILSQDIRYVKPVRPDMKIKVCCKVVKKIDSIKVLIIEARIYGPDGSVLIESLNKIKAMR